MKNADAQREIYSGVIMSLVKRKFIPKIKMTKNSTLVEIKWLSKERISDIEVQNSILAKYSK